MPSDPIRRTGLRPEFWKHHALEDLPRAEWEALCDGCAKCCLVKLEDEDTGAVAYTNIACRLLDLGTCRCGNYPLRRQLVKGCVVLNRDNIEEVLAWMPSTCAYRLVARGPRPARLAPAHHRRSRERAPRRRVAARAHGGGIRRGRRGLGRLRDRRAHLMWFTSDNAGPAHPAVIEAVTKANAGYAPSYGGEAAMARVTARIREVFEAPEAAVYLVATGTAANALSLACLCPPWGAVYCHRHAHVQEDECGAPEFYTGGAKLVPLDGPDGRIAPETLAEALARAAQVGVHNVQRGALSLTTATEAGTAYTPDQIRALTALAKARGLPVHLDGARFANALVRIGCTPAEMSWKAGIDVLSFGGTKNGLMGVEAVILFDPARAWEFELRRKRGGHLFSKHRYLAAQMEAYLDAGLWLEMAAVANARADALAAGLASTPGARILHPVEANIVFAAWPRAGHRAVQAAGAHYYLWPFDQSLEGPDAAPLSARLVCNWFTTEAEVAAFIGHLRPAKGGAGPA